MWIWPFLTISQKEKVQRRVSCKPGWMCYVGTMGLAQVFVLIDLIGKVHLKPGGDYVLYCFCLTDTTRRLYNHSHGEVGNGGKVMCQKMIQGGYRIHFNDILMLICSSNCVLKVWDGVGTFACLDCFWKDNPMMVA